MIKSRGPEAAAVCGLFLGVTWILTGLRVSVRVSVTKNCGADDSLLVAALVCPDMNTAFRRRA
jgi:hypothetical protein